MKASFLVLLPLLMLFGLGISSALQVSPTSFTIPSGVTSLFNITFYNNETVPLNITINTAATKIQYGAIFSNIGAKPNSFYLMPGQSQNVLFAFSVNTGFYSSTPISINFSITKNGVPSYFILSTPINQGALISLYNVSSAAAFTPNVPLLVNLSVNNLGASGIVIPVYYSLSKGSTTVLSGGSTITLNYLGVNVLPFKLNVPSTTASGSYTLTFSLNTSLGPISKSNGITINSYTAYSGQVTQSSWNLLGGSFSETFTNTGNTPVSSSLVSVPLNGFEALFLTSKSSSSGSPEVSSGALSTTQASLDPGQSLSLSYTVSYVPLYAIIVAALVAIFIYWYLNRRVVVMKEVVEHRATEGFIDIKIALKIRNVSKAKVTDLYIHDIAPLHALKISSIGPKSARIEKTGGGMSMTWRESELNPNDEVILMYEIKSKIGLIGGIRLMPATCSFRVRNKELKRKSNSLILNIH